MHRVIQNENNFANLCFHTMVLVLKPSEPSLQLQLVLSVCDAIGRMVKWLVANETFRSHYIEQILDTIRMLVFCRKEIPAIIILFVDSNDIKETKTQVEDHYQQVVRVIGHRCTLVLFLFTKQVITITAQRN